MMMTPVGQAEIAQRAHVQPDTVKKWRDRHPSFPKPRWTIGGGPAWAWEDILAWLVSTGRAPHLVRCRSLGGGTIVQEYLDGEDRWRKTATFVGHGYDGEWQAFPAKELADMLAPGVDAQQVADEHLQRWHEARQRWVREHPDEPMPKHLTG